MTEIKYVIETPQSEWLHTLESKGQSFTIMITDSMTFNTPYEAWKVLDFFNEEGLLIGCTVDKHKIVEIENDMGPKLFIGHITIGDRLHFVGVETQEFDIEYLRGGDGC